jgi:hypothetical protein
MSPPEVLFWEITVDLTISDLRVFCVWNSGDPPKKHMLYERCTLSARIT